MSSTISMKAALLLALLLAAAPARADVGVGDRFPPLPAAAPGEPALPSTQGKVVLVDFWASWCAPCKASFPAYARLCRTYGPRGLVLVAVSVDDDAQAYADFVDRFRPPFPVVRDADKRLVGQAAIPGMPTCYLIGKDGRVRLVHEGFHSWETERALAAQIERLLAEKE
jgi:thiol-disulfide isomerase/thioredoxin